MAPIWDSFMESKRNISGGYHCSDTSVGLWDVARIIRGEAENTQNGKPETKDSKKSPYPEISEK